MLVRATSIAVLLCVLLAGCVGPARVESDYRADVSNTAKTTRSAVESAALTVRAIAEGRAAAPYAARRLTEDEQEAHAALTAFGSVQPPGEEMDRLRSEVLEVVQRSSTVLAQLRIAAFRDDRQAVLTAAEPLQHLAEELTRFVQAEQP